MNLATSEPSARARRWHHRRAVHRRTRHPLTMRTFHTGAWGDDITLGLPRFEVLFEARSLKRWRSLRRFPVKYLGGGQAELSVLHHRYDQDTRRGARYSVPYSAASRQERRFLQKGAELTDGAFPVTGAAYPRLAAAQDIFSGSAARVPPAGVDINDKHSKSFRQSPKVRVEDARSTELLSAAMVDIFEFEDANAAVRARLEAGEEALPKRPASSFSWYTKASLPPIPSCPPPPSRRRPRF
jgi:DNA-directed RNA polymerase subunit beta'